MRSVDDVTEYKIPVKPRSWTIHSWFRKPKEERAVPSVAPTRIPPEKQNQKIDLEYFQTKARSESSYQVTLGPWIGWPND